MTTHDKLIHALTDFDQRQSSKRGYNPHALAIYFERLELIEARVAAGCDLRRAILEGFSDRVQDACLRALDLPLNAYTHA